MKKQNKSNVTPSYGPLVDVCKAFGISRSVAYELLSDGAIETFKLNARRYVYIESIRSLPQRLAMEQGGIR